MIRLQDPKKILKQEELKEFRTKLDQSLARLILKSEKGGNPFLYSFIATKKHEICINIPEIPGWQTAATDGEKFFWHPKLLRRMSIYELPIVMQHETIHIICDHVSKFKGHDHRLWGYAIDFVTNAQIQRDFKINKRLSKIKTYKFWGGELGIPINIDLFIKILKGERGAPKGYAVFVDSMAINMTPEEVYKKLLPYWNNSKVGRTLSNHLDGHIKLKVSKQKIFEEILEASKQAEKIEPGSTPGFVNEIIYDLTNPKINLQTYINILRMKQQQNYGSKNNWKKFKRRGLAMGLYLPKRRTYKVKWLAMIDTSGSMTNEDISCGISQLQSLGQQTDGIIVSCDAQVYWDSASKIENFNDLKTTKITGRGGTVFTDFFKNFPTKLGTDFDVVIIITDGYCNKIPVELKPSIETLWVITRNIKEFKQPFGKIIYLK